MVSYRAYGLTLRSELELPELIAVDTAPDVTVRFGRVERLPAEADSQWHSFWVTPEATCLYYQDIGAFLMCQGHEITIDPAPNVEERVLRLALLGPALSIILHQRGFLVLHASAVNINGGAAAFLGESGDGKSTMAGAFHTQGYPLIADDLTVVDFDGDGRPLVLPGFPQLKLWPEAVESFGANPDDLPRLHPQMEKLARRISERFSQNPVPLKSLYVLADAEALAIEPLHGQSAFVELVRHSHDALLLEATATASQHFFQCATLVKHVPLNRLNRPRSLSLLPEIVKLVERDTAFSS